MNVITDIKQAIREALPDSEVHVLDPMNDGVHLHALVISPSFRAIPLFKQHQAVMHALSDHFDSTALHALGLKTFTPEKWEQQKDQFPIKNPEADQ